MELSVIIPAYNEVQRLPHFLSECMPYLERALAGDYEVIVVDDGSSDGTAQMVEDWSRSYSRIRCIVHQVNRGKGAAVKTGMLASRGRCRLFVDADGSTRLNDEIRLRRELAAGAHVAIGSRASRSIRRPFIERARKSNTMENDVWNPPADVSTGEAVRWEVKRSRFVLGRVFAALTRSIVGLDFLDTQCGFKMFRHDASDEVFSRLTCSGFIFDVESLSIAQRFGYRIVEVPVNWHEVAGSKVNLVRDSLRMFAGLWRIRALHKELKPTVPVVTSNTTISAPARGG